MPFVSEYACTSRITRGRYVTEIGIKPVAYPVGTGFKRIDTDWANSGISERPHIVSASKLFVTVGESGDYRVHPTPDPDRYFEFGAPLIKVGGSWVRPGFGNRTRTGNRIKWTTDYEDAYIVHAGHYIKWGILLKNNYDRWSQFAMPMGTQGLTRSKGVLFADGVPVMRLRAPVVYDYANPDDTRQIAHEFVRQDGQWYALFTLPDLTGMSKPLIDPTLTLQPDAAAGLDCRLREAEPTYNYGTDTTMFCGNDAGSNTVRGLIQFDVSSIPSDATVDDATKSLYCETEGAAADENVGAHRSLVEWFEGIKDGAVPGATDGSTWNHRNANNGGQVAWTGGVGGVSGTEWVATAVDTTAITNASAWFDWDVKADVANFVSGAQTNHGWWVINTDEVNANTYKSFVASDHATTAQYPKLVVNWTAAAGGGAAATRIIRRGLRRKPYIS